MDEHHETPQPSSNKKLIIWTIGFFLIVGGIFAAVGSIIAEVDPFFHYHAADTTKYYYYLNSERYQNDGILRNFDYDAMITGTSMAQNFKASEVDALFDVHSVKTTFSGGSYREVGDRLKRALQSNDELKLVIRSLDMDFFFLDYDDLSGMADGDYPTYLYDDNPLNDYQYLLNRDVLFDRVVPMIQQATAGETEPGITDFDVYSRWMAAFVGKFGVNHVCEEALENYSLYYWGLDDSTKLTIRRSITYNILDIANAYPDVEFYYWFGCQNLLID